jgi:hypothetical protein
VPIPNWMKDNPLIMGTSLVWALYGKLR